MESLKEDEGDDQLDGDSSELTSLSSGISSLLSISSDVSSTSSSSGEIPAVPRLLLLESDRSEKDITEKAVVKPRCVGRSNRDVTWGLASVIGRRNEMEDAVSVIPAVLYRSCDAVGGCTAPGSKTACEISPVHFFGVYDGHGGSQVAKFCAKRMHEVIAEEWERTNTANGFKWQSRWEEALTGGFERTDEELLNITAAADRVGSTAVVVVLSGCQIITSNCGDSRAVLCRKTHIIPLTVDQKPDRPDELMRIEENEGKVINWNGARVFGVLTMSRAIGDWYLRPWIIPVPEVTFTTRSEDDECLIIASDGLWDVMTNEEVGRVARRLLRRRRKSNVLAAQTVADDLSAIAYNRNSSDNISIIVIDLKPKRKRVSKQ